MRDKLLEDARRSTVAIDAAELSRLTATRADLADPVYAAVKDRLRQLQSVNPNVRVVSVLRFKPELQKVVFLADSTEAGAPDASFPGDDSPEAAESAGVQKIIRTGSRPQKGRGSITAALRSPPTRRLAATPVPDRSIRKPTFSGLMSMRPDGVGRCGRPGLSARFMCGLALGLPLIAWFVARRQMEQRHVIRNLSEAVEQSHSAIVIIGLDGRIEFANRGLIRAGGLHPR